MTVPEALAMAPAEPGLPLRNTLGRFAASGDFHTMLDGVAEVARAAAGNDPQRARLISKARWDRWRGYLRRFDLPLAETVRQRLSKGAKAGTHVTWMRALEVALVDPSERLLVLNRLKPAGLEGITPAVELSDERAIRCVVQRLRRAPMETEYEQVSRQILSERSRVSTSFPSPCRARRLSNSAMAEAGTRRSRLSAFSVKSPNRSEGLTQPTSLTNSSTRRAFCQPATTSVSGPRLEEFR